MSALQSASYWQRSPNTFHRFPALDQDIDTDVCVVGAGIAGLSTAYFLARAGLSVAVLDDGQPGGGQTCRTTAHLSSVIDDRFTEIERIHGVEGARLAAESHAKAIDAIEEISLQHGIDCSFQRLDGYLFLPPGGDQQLLVDELAAARRTGHLDVDWAPRAPFSFDTGRCLVFRRQGQFHPLRYLEGLAKQVLEEGGRIYSGTHARQMTGGKQARVVAENGKEVRCRAIVVATNTPVNDLVAIHTKQAPYMSYAIAARVPQGSVPLALYWDTLDPYHYVRLQPATGSEDHDVLIVGGEDHKTGQADDQEERFRRLEQWSRERFPQMDAVTDRWGGQVMETLDGLGFIGRNPLDKENVYIATGDSGMGMTHGTIAGMLISELIQGRAHPWEKLYDPSRKPVGAVRDFLSENLNVAAQYASLVTPGEVSDPAEVPAGEGAIMRRGLQKLAVYRAPTGEVTTCSAICPHLKCVVGWNPTEKTWDCPCHGSRFTAEGKVIVGPANSDLEPADVTAEN